MTTSVPPGTFINPAAWLLFWDIVRVMSALACLAVVAMTPFAMAKPDITWHQRARFIGFALFGVAVVGAYLQQLGTMPVEWWRTLFIFAGSALGAAGLFAFLNHYQGRAPARRTARHRR